MVRKECGDEEFSRMIVDENDYHLEYEHKLYDYYDLPRVETIVEKVKLKNQVKSTQGKDVLQTCVAKVFNRTHLKILTSKQMFQRLLIALA